MKRCDWANASDAERDYHDQEWGVPIRDPAGGQDARLFEMLTLEGAQAGLSWSTILNKREGYRRLFSEFDPAKVARFSQKKIEKLLTDPAIVRHRGKVESTISNAQAVLTLQEEEGSLSNFLWAFVNHQPIQNRYRSMKEVPAETEQSKAMSKALKKRGFRFVGPTTCYAFMQAAGMVNDHLISCFRYDAV